jgi:3-oxoacyl-[acyl-carrier protein] reductase
MGKLNGKIAIVTGGARGLGRAYAHRLADLGAKVAVTDKNLKSYAEFEADASEMTGANTADEIIAKGGQAKAFEFDISDRDAVFAMAADVQRAWGRVDILVANAGGGSGTPKETTATTVSRENLEVVTARNFYGTVFSCSAVAPFMKEQHSGKIVTVASFAGLRGGEPGGGGYAHYAANKAAIVHYTHSLASELLDYDVNANCIAPGFIATGRVVEFMKKAGFDGQRNDSSVQEKERKLHRAGTVEDCAKVIEFLCTDLSDFVTGHMIPVGGVPIG